MEPRGDEEPPCSGDTLEEEQRMASSSGLEEQIDTALHHQTPAAAPAGAGRVVPDRAAAAAIQRQIAARRARETDAFSANVALARSLADQSVARREQLKRLKDQLGVLQSQLSEALTLQSRKESERKHAAESIFEATARIERLHSLIADSRAKRDMRAAIIPTEPQALESLEAESNQDTERDALLWFDKFLGFRVIGGEGAHQGVKFVFDKIDPQRPEKEYSFRVRGSPSFELIDCDPHIKDIEQLVKDVHSNEHLFKFVRMAREKFQSSFMNGTPVNSTSEDAHNQSQSASKNDLQLLPAKRGATALSGVSPSVLRRSPRVESPSVLRRSPRVESPSVLRRSPRVEAMRGN